MSTKPRRTVLIKRELYDQMKSQRTYASRIWLLGAEDQDSPITEVVQLERLPFKGCSNAAGATTQQLTEGYMTLAKAGCNWIARANVRGSQEYYSRTDKLIIITRGFKLEPVE